MPFVPSVVIPPLQPGTAQPGSGYAVPPSQVAGASLGVRQIIEAGDGILVEVGATTVVSLDTAFTSSLYAPLASPAFTGTPTAPTAALGTNTTQLATTAFVTAAVTAGGGGGAAATITFTPTGTITANDVQAALEEVADEAVQVSGDTMTGYLTLSADPANPLHAATRQWVLGVAATVYDDSVHVAGDTMTGGLILPLSAAAVSPLRIPHGAAPTTSLTNGDIWTTAAGLFARINGTTVGPMGAGGGGGTAVGTTFTPAAGIEASNVQAAIEEVVADVAGSYLTTSTAASTYAPLASPTFTGTPLSVTGTDGTSSTQIATQAYVETAIGDRVLDTGDTMTGQLILPAATTGLSPLRIPHGTAHSSPTNGDIWTTSTSMYARINGATVDLAAGGGLTDAPSDGAMYARMDGSWQEAVPNEPGQWLLNGEYNITTYATQKKAQAVNASATTVISRLSGDYVDLTLDINITTLTLSGWPASGTMGQIHLAINFTGAFTITWPAAVKWPGGTAPTLTGVSGKVDHVMLVSDNGGTTIWGFVMGQDYDA